MFNSIRAAVNTLIPATNNQSENFVSISADKPATLTVDANYTTPYRWQVLNAPAGLDITDKYTRKEANPNMMGVGGKVDFTIKPGTCKPGQYEIQIGLCRIGTSEPVDTKTMSVSVSASSQAISAAKGEPATVEIPANYTTPFEWRVVNAPEGFNVTNRYTTKPNPGRMMGVGGTVTFTIDPQESKPGTYTVELGNFRLGDDSNAWDTKSVEVVVS